MKQVLIKQGKATVEEVPAPQVEAGTLLVQITHSCISVGTEMSGLKSGGLPLWQKAMKNPAKVKRAVQMVAEQGIQYTVNFVQGKMTTGYPTGYSAAGTVLEVGEGLEHLYTLGDRIACGGAQCAYHAEVNRVPANLAIPIPDGVDNAVASTVALGAIALQGVRRAQPTLGETFVVVGLGLLGQLTAQMLQANGCRVIGVDLYRKRIDLARSLGMEMDVHPDDELDVDAVRRLTDGIGADGVIITAATPSDSVISTAFQMCRRKGRVVLVGDVGLHLNRADFYQKEIDFLISTSYGPGRYDRLYEEEGLDYPVAYVRWTESRNMSEYLRLIADGKLQVIPLLKAKYPIDQVETAYEVLNQGENRPLMVILQYPARKDILHRTVPNPLAHPVATGHIRVGVAGASEFAKATHLPNMQALSETYQIRAVMSRTGHNAVATSTQFGASYSTTDYRKLLADPDIDLVLISTRHHLHAEMALNALKAGKHVLLEKPLALTRSEVDSIKAFYEQAGADAPVLLTGFNRRFSPFAQRIHEHIQQRTNPMIINYRMNAGYIPLDHWVHGAEGGGRNLGEACHIYDLFTFLTNSKMIEITAYPIRPANGYYGISDNFVASMRFEDGSIATLTYTALGAKDFPKEQMEVFVDGKVFRLDNYQHLQVFGANVKPLYTRNVDKGHRREIEMLARVLHNSREWISPLWQQIQATEIALCVEDQLKGR